MAQSNALGAESLLQYMSDSLPRTTESSKLLKDSYAAVALFGHSCMLAVGFRLIGLGEDHKIGRPSTHNSPKLVSNQSKEAHSDQTNTKALPSEWDASSTYAFRYAHPQSSMEFLLKVSRLGNKALVFGIGLGDDKTAQFEIKAQDYISEGSISNVTPDSDLKRTIADVFISPGRITDLSSLFKSNIIQKLVPGIHKEGYQEEEREALHDRRETEQGRGQPRRDPLRDGPNPEPARPHPYGDPLAAEPRRPGPAPDFAPPGFEDELEINRPPRGGIGGFRPPNLGERDLYPPGLGPHDPLRMDPLGGRGGFGGIGGGGMHPTFDDPLFQGGGGGGLAQFDPRHPQGARYDPVGPGDGPPHLGGPRFPGGPGGPRGGFGGAGAGNHNPFGGFGGGDFI